MKVNGGRVISLGAEKLDGNEFKGYDINIQVTDLKEVDKRLELHFEHATTYKDNYAKMRIKGVVYAEADDKERKKMTEEWKKTKQMPNEIAEEVLMAINYITSTVGTLLAFGINVSAPVNVPRTRIMNLPGQPASKAG
ncbi:MAG: hypothetical protein QXR53_00465 [Candidatus Norongarragalinales archaeon]